jgi:hypothetical protein
MAASAEATARHIRSKHKSWHWIAPYAAFVIVIMDQEDMVGWERATCASTASSLNLRRANARRPLTHSVQVCGRRALGYSEYTTNQKMIQQTRRKGRVLGWFRSLIAADRVAHMFLGFKVQCPGFKGRV